ncbi:hypothetical protein BDU57DRAFT_291185 [Ampelomyces quisqualis]|uniref:Uncharacterized protein n=1 Tax=Ampelomyces quisqualis TaxID=50730 RepID=A0A6A5QIJ2_AMPQU|nr:hypothetical protein BDU57DRAFT_291185 [Ampelomyces quisqualis]
MRPVSGNEIERQDTEASITASPHCDQPPPQVPSKMPQIRSRSSDFATFKYCGHMTSEFLLARLPSSQLCPGCKFREIISKIKAAQQQLVERGGAFASKEIGKGHNNVKKHWRVPKIHLANTVAQYEALLSHPGISLRDRYKLESLLDIWNREKDGLAEVPGMRQVPTEKEPSQKEHEVARLMIELLKLVLEKEMAAEDKVSNEGSVATNNPSNRHEQQQSQTTISKAATVSACLPATPKSASCAAPNRTVTPLPRESILKRKPTSSLASPQTKRIRITDTVTLSPPRLNITNPNPFTQLSAALTLQPHAKHTEAEDARPRYSFQRRKASYEPGAWASGAEEEKANTSFATRSWERAEKARCKEIEEEEEERRVVEGLEIVTGAWVGVWWVRGVVVCVGLEELGRVMGGTERRGKYVSV